MSAVLRRPGRGLPCTVQLLVLLLLAASGRPASRCPDVRADPALAERSPLSTLPILHIDTTDGRVLAQRDEELPAAFALTTASGRPLQSGRLSLRGRGHSSWLAAKRSYRLELATAAPLLGMPDNRHWVLLANHLDRTLLRNDVAFELSRQLGMAYTPRSRFVELELHGAYQGVYQLVEHVRVGRDRVAIEEMAATDVDEPSITGGYLLEVDQRYDGPRAIRSARTGMVFRVDSPRDLFEPQRAAQRRYLEDWLQRVDEAILGPDFRDPVIGYASCIDVDSVIGWFLVNELLRNVDGNLRLSTWLYKPRGGRLCFGPVWDFDLAIGNIDYGGCDQPVGWHVRSAPWFARLFEDPAFQSRVRARWAAAGSGVRAALAQHIDTMADRLRHPQEGNFARWPVLTLPAWPGREPSGSHDREVAIMRRWLFERWDWLDAEFGCARVGVAPRAAAQIR